MLRKALLGTLFVAVCLLSQSSVSADVRSNEFVTPLYAGQHTLAGYVSVWVDYNAWKGIGQPVNKTLFVEYSTICGWYLTEIHLFVGEQMPAKIAPGQFPYSAENLPNVTSYLFEIPFDPSWSQKTILLAAHCVVGNSGDPAVTFADGILGSTILVNPNPLGPPHQVNVSFEVQDGLLLITFQTLDGSGLRYACIDLMDPDDTDEFLASFEQQSLGLRQQTVFAIPLEQLGAACDVPFYLKFSAKVTDNSWVGCADPLQFILRCEPCEPEEGSETAWGFGPTELRTISNSNRWGWFFPYTLPR
jgi:hypothetical protein